MNDYKENLGLLQEMLESGEITEDEHREMVSDLMEAYNESGAEEDTSSNVLSDVITQITERFNDGEITEEENDLLIERAMERFSDTASVTTESPSVNLDSMVTALTEKYNAGELSEEDYDTLVERAMERYSEDGYSEEEVTESEEYTHIMEVLTERYNNGDLSEEDYNALLERAAERYLNGDEEEVSESFSHDITEIFEAVHNGDIDTTEAVDMLGVYNESSDSRKSQVSMVKAAHKRAKADIKSAKQSMRKEDYKKARNLLEAAKEELEKVRSIIKNMKSDGSDAALGAITTIAGLSIGNILGATIQVNNAKRNGLDVSGVSKGRIVAQSTAEGIAHAGIIGATGMMRGQNAKEAFNMTKKRCLSNINHDIMKINKLIKRCNQG